MKEKFIKSTIILLIGGLITKILGLIIKITMSRLIGTKGLAMYMLILPTFSLLINIGTFSIPIALSKLISEDTRNNKNLFFSTLPILFIVNITLITIVILTSKYISTTLLKNKDLYISILSMSLVIPFTTISAICRSYFFGKEKMTPHVISNIVEDIVRLLLMIIGIPYFLQFGLKYAVCFIILSNIISEVTSTIILIFFLPKSITLKRKDFHPNKVYIKDTLKISIPNTLSRLIGSIAYFLEPIILITFLSKNYSINYITHEYGIISGYVIPLILLPSFFTLAISQALLPVISKEYIKGNKKYIRKKINLTLSFTIILGLLITIPLTIYPNFFLNFLYKTTEGANYMRLLAPICLLEYIQSPISFSIEAIGKSKINFYASIISVASRTIILIILSNFKLGIYSFIISLSINIMLTTLYSYIKLNKYLK